MIRTLLPLICAAGLWAAEAVPVVASTTDLGDITRIVGGDTVVVNVLARADEDPHAVEPRPSFKTALAGARLLVENGLGYDTHWLDTAGAGRQDLTRFVAASAVTVLKAPEPADVHQHHHGHQHAAGNPHFLCDPVAGVQVALALAPVLANAAPQAAAGFQARAEGFALAVAEDLLGAQAIARCGPATVLTALRAGDLAPLVGPDLGGHLARLRPLADRPLLADHDGWPYLARRFDLAIIGFLEPEPCLPASTAHLARLIGLARGARVVGIIKNPWSDARQARLVADALMVRTAVLAPHSDVLPGVHGYRATIAANVAALAALTPAP